MDKEKASKEGDLPASSFSGPAAELIAHQLLLPPSHPGAIGKIEHYDIIRLIGRGGMGFVFLARSSDDGGLVAIKTLRPEYAVEPRIVRRFLKEAKHLQKLNHRRIMPVLAVSERQETPWFAMPHYPTGSLSGKIVLGEPLSSGEALDIARQLAEALEFIHSKGLVHRDIKPGNILLESPGVIRLSDFGLAQSLFNDSMVDLDRVKPEGTAPYMSPATAEGQAEDTRCDIYGFGAVLYEMLTGRPPYEGASASEILKKIRSGPPTPIGQLNPGVNPGLAAIAECAMARQHRDRYASMADVMADLEAVAEDRPPRARGMARERLLKKIAGAFGFAVLAALIAGLLWTARPPKLKLLKTEPLPVGIARNKLVSAKWDADGRQDLLYLDNDALGVLHSTGERTVPRKLDALNTSGSLILTMAGDITGDGLDEVFVSWSEGTNAHIAAINQDTWPVQQFVFNGDYFVHPQWGTNHVWLQALRVEDLEGDGKLELLARVIRAWGDPEGNSPWPRGMCCFDVATGKRKWYFETAPFVFSVETADLDGDGAKEILLGSNSPENGKRLPDGTDDSHVYLYALAHDGRLLWRSEMAGRYAETIPIGNTASTNRGSDVVAIGRSQMGYSDWGIVRKYSGTGAVLAEYSVGMDITAHAFLTDADPNRCAVLVADRAGNLHLLNSNLHPLEKRSLLASSVGWVDIDIFGAHHLLGTSDKQFLIHSWIVQDKTPGQKPFSGDDRAEVLNELRHQNELIVVNTKLEIVDRAVLSEESALERFHMDVLPGKAGNPPIIRTVWPELRYYSFGNR